MNIKNKVRSSYPSNAQWINHTIAENIIETWNKYVHKDQFLQPDATTPDNQKITLKTDINGNLQWKNAHGTQMLAERILQDYAVTCLPSTRIRVLDPNAGSYNATLAKKDLEYLNLKLDAVRKTITAWDVYNIKGVAESEEEVDHMMSVATPNTAFISNVRVEKNNIAPGDIVFTDLNNQVHIIQHAAAGYFYPAKWERLQKEVEQSDGTKQKEFTNTYQLTYSWSTTSPEIIKDAQEIPSDKISPTVYDKMFAKMDTGTNAGFARTYEINSADYNNIPIQNYPNNLDGTLRTPLVTTFTLTGEKIWIDNILFEKEIWNFIDHPSVDGTEITLDGINFIINNNTEQYRGFIKGNNLLKFLDNQNKILIVYQDGKWIDDKYRHIILVQSGTDTTMNYIKGNASLSHWVLNNSTSMNIRVEVR